MIDLDDARTGPQGATFVYLTRNVDRLLGTAHGQSDESMSERVSQCASEITAH